MYFWFSDRGPHGKSHVLAVCFKYGDIFLMSGYDDICPVMVYTTLTGKPLKTDYAVPKGVSGCGKDKRREGGGGGGRFVLFCFEVTT